MLKRFITILLTVVALSSATAQRVLDVSSGTFSSKAQEPAEEDASKFKVSVHSVGKIPYIMDFSDKTTIAKVGSKSLREKEIVREDRTWRYYSSVNADMDPSDDIYLDVCFSGTTEIDGNEYLNCYVWKTDEEFSEETAALIGYMREDEAGRVLVRYIPYAQRDAMKKGIDIQPYAPMMNDLEVLSTIDVLLFDPNLKEGDILKSSTSDEVINDKFGVDEIKEVRCLGDTWKLWILGAPPAYGYGFYEGIGSEYGLLPFPGAWPMTFSADAWHLVEVLDGDGNRIFAPSEIITNGIDDIQNDGIVVDEKIYNIDGTEVREPKKSGVYVRKQLLDNGNIHTEKIIVR